MQSLHNKPNLLFLIAIRSYKLASKIVLLTPKLRGPVHTKRLEDVWKVNWRAIEKKYGTNATYPDAEIQKIEENYRAKLPNDLKRYLTTVSGDIWGQPFDDNTGFFEYDITPCAIPPNTLTFAGYACPYVAQGHICQICSAPDDMRNWGFWRDKFTTEEWMNMPICDNDTTRGMAPIGPNYDGDSDWIVLNAVDQMNYGTVWRQNSDNMELSYIAKSFGEYLMEVLRGQIIRERIVPKPCIPVVWANLGQPFYLDFRLYPDKLGIVQNNNNF